MAETTDAVSRTQGERIVALEASYEHVATKADIQAVKTDIANLRAEVKGDIANLRVELKGDIDSLRTDFISFQSEIRGAVRTMLRIIGFGIPITAIIVGAVVHFLNQGGM